MAHFGNLLLRHYHPDVPKGSDKIQKQIANAGVGDGCSKPISVKPLAKLLTTISHHQTTNKNVVIIIIINVNVWVAVIPFRRRPWELLN